MIHVYHNDGARPRLEVVVAALIGVSVLLAYYLVALLVVPLLLRAWAGLPRESMRKVQHVAYSLSIFLLLGLFDRWYLAIGAAGLLVVVAYPILALWEGRPSYRRLLADREGGGELRRQLLWVQLSFAVLIAVFWGGLGPDWRPLIAVAVMAWGFGDAAAALVGRRLGRHAIVHRAVDAAKTLEGTLAMIVAAGLAVFLTMLLYVAQPWTVSLIVALVVAPLAAAIEVFSRRGTDTLTVPLGTAAALVPLLILFSAVGR
jgi:phytol kinase